MNGEWDIFIYVGTAMSMLLLVAAVESLANYEGSNGNISKDGIDGGFFLLGIGTWEWI